jgi:hypothetical protein
MEEKNESKTVELHRFAHPGRHPFRLPGEPAPGDPLPQQARKILKQMLDDNAVLPEYSGAIVISQTILQYDADHNGKRGSLCDSIGVVQPALEDRLSRETEHAADYERISFQVDDLKKTLKCDQLPQGK